MNRILGIIFTVIAIAVMVFAILNWGNYKSLCFKGGDDLETIDENLDAVEEIETEIVLPVDMNEIVEPVEQVDSLSN